jgi:transcription elongation factor GreB
MAGTQYITRAGWYRLKEELDYLCTVDRPKTTQAVAEAAALGDRSENAEYLYGKKALRSLDRRITFLRKRLALLRIVDPHPQQAGRVFFGAWVTLLDQQGERLCYRLVGADEFDLRQHWISINVPVARALLGKSVNYLVTLFTPKGKITYRILAIDYQPPKESSPCVVFHE